MTWSRVTIGQIKAKTRYSLVGGPFGSNLVTTDYREDGIPVIQGGNVPGDKAFSFDNLVFVSEEKADQLLPNNACNRSDGSLRRLSIGFNRHCQRPQDGLY
jgi:type I restriction enzyme S subunit